MAILNFQQKTVHIYVYVQEHLYSTILKIENCAPHNLCKVNFFQLFLFINAQCFKWYYFLQVQGFFIPEAETAVMPDGRLAQTPDDQWPADEAPEKGWM